MRSTASRDLDGRYPCFCHGDGGTRARRCETRRPRDQGGHRPGPLHGIPYGLKDTIDTRSIRTTAGSRAFLDHVPERDAAVAAAMREAGGVLLGKLATYEFGTVGPSFDLPFPAVRNP